MTTAAKGRTATSKEAASAGAPAGSAAGSDPGEGSPAAAPPKPAAPRVPHHLPTGLGHRLRQGARRMGGRAYWTTPRLVRGLTALSLAALLGLGATATGVLGGARDGTDTIGHGAAPQAARAADLYFALSDMDAQAANLLLIGADPDYTALHRTTLDTYEQRRAQADDDLQQAAQAAADDSASQRAVQRVLGELGSYEALVARAQLLEDQAKAPAGKPSEEALTAYRQATDLLRQQLLPAADEVTAANEAVVDHVYAQQRSDLDGGWWELAAVGLFALVALFALQRTLAVRYHRVVNPALAAVTLVTAVVLAAGLHLVSTADGNLVTAKSNAYDSVIALSRARAVAYDMNADESRYLADPVLAATYQRTYLEKSQAVVRLDGATVTDYDGRLETAAAKHLADRSVPFGGYLGTELNNITFPGERDAAERVLAAFRSYQQVDHKIRVLHDAGQLKDAVTLNTGLSKGQSNYEFDQLSKAMGDTIDVNSRAMDAAVADTDDALDGTTATLAAVVLAAALVLVAVGVRPRLREYR
ncbi:MerC domain-containing protein [Kitasatospora sp. NPDC059747]|uniref:MerC domain-containing protein n=1 Tax=Kitasatospora sp. NPDC059747 TaxID=3346930 RepID=UPI0036608761